MFTKSGSLSIGAFYLLLLYSALGYSSDKGLEANVWAQRVADSIMAEYPDPWLMRKSDGKYRWGYTQGLVLKGYLELAQLTASANYEVYAQRYLDHYIDSKGIINSYDLNEYNIDSINSGKLLFYFYSKTRDTRYLTALKTLRKQLEWHPRTRSGVYWHKLKYPWQVWADGLYMAAPFYAEYEKNFNNSKKSASADVVHQFTESHRHLHDKKTGLLFHGFDESRMQAWADSSSGRSPGFWSRALGWYAMALVDTLEHIDNKTEAKKLRDIMLPLFKSIAAYQDESGLWYQVPDKAGQQGNYLESSASAMFMYSFAKAARLGLVEKKYQDLALKAYSGFNAHLLEYDNVTHHVTLKNVCRSAGLGGEPYRDGTYNYYVNQTDRVTNDAHGLGSLLMALVELSLIKS